MFRIFALLRQDRVRLGNTIQVNSTVLHSAFAIFVSVKLVTNKNRLL